MSRLEDTRRAFIQSIETDYPAFDRDGAFQDSVRMENAVKAFRLAAEAFARELDQCSYATTGVRSYYETLLERPGRPLNSVDDAVQAFIDAFTWDIRGEALSFLHEAGKGVE